jgi:hypothetical protein
MGNDNKLFIYHLHRKDGSSLFLHPFGDSEKFTELLEKYDIEGKYGKEPRVESLTMFRNELYRMIEDHVKGWVSEIRFLPKFLMASGLFLLAYLFLSLVVRDPLPMLDEIAISLGLSIGLYIMLGKRDQHSNLALKKRVDLRTRVDRIVFRESTFVREVEEALQRNESGSSEEVIEYMLSPPERSLTEEEKEDAHQIAQYLRKRFNSRELKKQEKLVSRIIREKEPEKKVKIQSMLAETKNIDLSLFAVYTRIKRNYNRVSDKH